jgi:sec-independent protein translocase protein TatA
MGLENPLHIAIILVVLLLLFGARKLPEMGRGLGQGIRGFKDGLTGRDESGDADKAPAEPAAAAAPPAQLPAGPVVAEPVAAASEQAEAAAAPVGHPV